MADIERISRPKDTENGRIRIVGIKGLWYHGTIDALHRIDQAACHHDTSKRKGEQRDEIFKHSCGSFRFRGDPAEWILLRG